MYRLFKKYSLPAGYDGIPMGLEHIPLDRIDCVGQARVADIHRTGRNRGLLFADSILLILDAVLFTNLLLVRVDKLECVSHTAPRWKPHLEVLQASGILVETTRSRLKAVANYFAVPKGTNEARAVINLRALSRRMTAPPTTNLPEIETVLRLLSGTERYLVIGDFRHFFHQFRVADPITDFFGLICGGRCFRWTTMPMGWSYSPRIAQCAAWTVLLEAAFRAKLARPADFQNLCSTPTYARLQGGFCMVWYDNVLAGFANSDSRDRFHQKLQEVCREPTTVAGQRDDGFNIRWKHLDSWNLNKATPHSERLPVYLGMQFTTTRRDREGNTRTQWRHDPAKVSRWSDLTTLPVKLLHRTIARAVGVIIWDATISGRPLYQEATAINLLREVARSVRSAQAAGLAKVWDRDMPEVWEHHSAALHHLQDRVRSIITSNEWRELPERPSTTHTILAASDASGGSTHGEEASIEPGWGFLLLNEELPDEVCAGTFPPELVQSHIYLKEMWSAVRCVEHICSRAPRARIVLGIDNTAVVGALRGRYSSNQHANEMIQRLDRVLAASSSVLEVVPLRSEDNPADGPSRKKPVVPRVRNACLHIFQKFMEGKIRVEPVSVDRAPEFTGELRHDDHDLLLDECVDDQHDQ